MVTLSEVPLVELEDVFGEDDFVGPFSEVVKDKPNGGSTSSNNKPNEDQASKRRRDENGPATSQQQRTTISLPATNLPLNTASSLAPGAVLYTPNHPNELPRVKQTRQIYTRRSQLNGLQQGLNLLPPVPSRLNTHTIAPRSSIHSMRSQRNNLIASPPQNANHWLTFQNRLARPMPGFVNGTSPPVPGPSNLNWSNANQVLPPPNSLSNSHPLEPAQAHSSSAIKQSQSLLQRSVPSRTPFRAHSNDVSSPQLPPHFAQPILPPNPPQPMFNSQAAPVRSAQEDFFRQLAAALPNVDVNQLYRQITTNPTQPIQLPVPAGVNSQVVQQQLQNSLESYMLQALNRGTFQPPLVQAQQPPPYQDILNEILADQQATLQQIHRPLLPPNEDDMAKQDQDADANQDDEFHEVETYADYNPAKLRIGKPHPDPIVETSSLATVEPPDVYYGLRLPPEVIESGQLSALQLESVIYASQQHNKLLPDEQTRGGFLIGDGAGVGKGRTIAGIIFENYLCGRRKSIWLSVSTDLKLDAERDLRDIGAKKIPVHLLGKFTYGKKIGVDSGVIFTTYSGLVSKSQTVKGQLGSRLGQLVQWAGSNFDGVIVFDECHKAKNISLDKNKKQKSKAAEYALEIQKRLPNARVVYASATGASETKHLGYMVRLGIWGRGTAYKTFHEFCGAIEKRGVGAMELVAVDLKMRGAYIARQLSFKTTSFEIRIAHLNSDFIKLYDDCVELWSKALHHFHTAIELCGDKLRRIWASFWAAHQKFFKYLCIGAKVPLVVQIAKEALEAGKCVVIGLQSTGEAKTLEALEDGDINEFVSTARATFESLVENHFPGPRQGSRRRTAFAVAGDQEQPPPSVGGSSSSVKASSDSGSSTSVDETWQEALEELWGKKKEKVEEKELSADALANKELIARNQKVLAELAAEKRDKPRENGRAMRAAKRRNLKRERQSTRIKKPVDESDTDISNPLSVSSDEHRRDTSDDTYSGGSSDDDDDDDEETEDDGSSNTVIDSDDKLSVEVKRHRPSTDESTSARGANKGDVSDSDSDVVITAVKPKKPPEVIFLDTDDEDDAADDNDSNEDGLHQYHPIRVHREKLIELRDELLNSIDKLSSRLPANTLDDLIDQFGGPSKVAEMTGRKGRVVKDEDGQISYKQRNDNDALDNMNIAEKERFMNGEKLVAIISEAASSGISLQADKRVKNTRRRVHITIELPWSADRAIQQFGRTHRSNQVCGPEYVFIISELAGEKRFASIVAKRLESLGALTHGDRRATTDSRDLSQFNIANRYCKQALEHLVRTIECSSPFANIKPDYPQGNFYKDAREAFIHSGLAKVGSRIWIPEAAAATRINHFLNRLLGMKVGIQNAIFKLFTDYLDRLIIRKKITGSYDSGILELNYDSGKTRCSQPEDFFLKTEGGVVKCSLRSVQVERGISWESAIELLEGAHQDKRNGFYTSTNPLTNAKSVLLALREPSGGLDMFRSYKPNTGRNFKPQYISFIQDKSDKCTLRMAEKIWRHVYEDTDKQCVHLCFFKSCKRIEARLKCDVGMRHRNYCILSGGVLTAWPYLESQLPGATQKLQIVRLKLDANNRVIGPIIPQDAVDKVRIALKKGEKGVEFR